MVDHLLTFSRSIQHSSGWNTAQAFNGKIIGAAGDSKLQFWDVQTGNEIRGSNYSSVSFTDAPANMVIVNSASAFFGSTSANASLQICELFSGYVTRSTGFVQLAVNAKGKQIAWNPRSNQVCAVSSNGAGGVGFYNVATGAMQVNNTLGGANNYWAVYPHATNNNFLVIQRGSTNGNGQISEVTWNGSNTISIVRTVVYDMTSSARAYGGGGINTGMQSLIMTPDGNNVIISDDRGGLVLATWPGLVVQDRMQLAGGNTASTGNSGLMLSDMASGFFMAGLNSAPAAPGLPFFVVVRATSQKLTLLEHQFITRDSAIKDLGMDLLTGYAWVLTSDQWLRLYKMTAPYPVNVQTRIQNPPGTDVSGRIIRIRDLGQKSYIDTDVVISAGATSLPSTAGGEYYEISIVGSGGSAQWDWRKFNV